MANRGKRFNKDISNKAVVIILVLFIVVSIISLGVYTNALDKTKPDIRSVSEGKVTFTILKAPAEPQKDVGSGKIGLTVVNPPANIN